MVELWILCAIAVCYVVNSWRANRASLKRWDANTKLAMEREKRDLYWDAIRVEEHERKQRSNDWTQLSQLTADVCHRVKTAAVERGDFESAARIRINMEAMREAFLRICDELERIEEAKP